MESKKLSNGNFLIRTAYSKFPVEIDSKHLFRIISDLKAKFEELRNYINYLQEDEEDITRVLIDNSYYLDELMIDDGYKLKFIADDLDILKENLKAANDDVKTKEELWELSDEGFTLTYHTAFNNEYIWEKQLCKTEDTDVIEEVYIYGDTILHRKRTIIYDISKPGVKSSISIKYEDLPINKNFMEMIRHSLRTLNK